MCVKNITPGRVTSGHLEVIIRFAGEVVLFSTLVRNSTAALVETLVNEGWVGGGGEVGYKG